MIGLAVLTFFFLSFLYFLFLLLLSGIGLSWLSASQPWFSVLLPGLLPPFFFFLCLILRVNAAVCIDGQSGVHNLVAEIPSSNIISFLLILGQHI